MNDVFHSVSMVMNVDQAEIAKIVHDYLERGIVSDYDRLNCPKPPIYIGPIKVKTLKERLEETKMNATSTEEFKDIIAIDFELQTFPNPDTQDKFIVSATNRDDIFCFVFEGPCLRDACRKAGLFNGWEKDQKIKELEEENKKLKQEKTNLPETPITDAMLIDDYNRLTEENKQLKKENDKLKKIVDYWSTNPEKENEKVDILLKELERVIIEKNQLEEELRQWKKEDEEPSSRSDILDLAKKCVCGKREQDYGTPESNFQLIADLWNQYLFKEPGTKEVFGIGPMDVSMMMALMKIARIRNGGGSGDSFVDLAGYAACGGEIWHSNKETNTDSSQETN